MFGVGYGAIVTVRGIVGVTGPVNDIAGMATNSVYAINIDDGLTVPHEPLINEDDWIKANVGLSANSGRQWLGCLSSLPPNKSFDCGTLDCGNVRQSSSPGTVHAKVELCSQNGWALGCRRA